MRPEDPALYSACTASIFRWSPLSSSAEKDMSRLPVGGEDEMVSCGDILQCVSFLDVKGGARVYGLWGHSGLCNLATFILGRI